MKVLFAVSNEEISEKIVKKYQQEYKEIISYKNVYYFNAILKEIQKDKSYDRIVISEELETFSHTQYDQIDKFIFDKLDSISDEASNIKGNDTPIILICSDRRAKGEQMLVKLFGIGIYNAIIGNDRGIEEVCELIHRPRLKKEAKNYYKIDTEEVNYQSENENDVSEMEIQNILAHYKSLGKNESRFIDSFNNIAAQYNDTQLRIISKFLPLNVRAVLEEKSPKYQQIMSFNNSVANSLRYDKKQQEESGPSETLLKPKTKNMPLSKPVVIPSAVNMGEAKKLSKAKPRIEQSVSGQSSIMQQTMKQPITEQNRIVKPKSTATRFVQHKVESQIKESVVQPLNVEEQPTIKEPVINQPEIITQVETTSNVVQPEQVVTTKRGRGRPRKTPLPEQTSSVETPKRGRGRPRKETAVPVQMAETTLPGFEEVIGEPTLPGFEEVVNDNMVMPGLTEEPEVIMPKVEEPFTTMPGLEENNAIMPGIQEEPSVVMPGLEETDMATPSIEEDINAMMPGIETNAEKEYEMTLPGIDDYEETQEQKKYIPHTNNVNNQYGSYNTSIGQETNIQKTSNLYSSENQVAKRNNNYIPTKDLTNLMTPDKKIVTFVGTSKNGTSFIVNHVAQLLSSMGINTAILDATTNRNSYYIYTKNEEELRNTAAYSLENLTQGIDKGIKVNKNLTVFTSLVDDKDTINNVDEILETLLMNYSLILIDCDFDSPYGYFKQSNETYLVQSLDVLTIQPLTAFLRELKGKNILDEKKLRIILNKSVKLRGITEKTIIGGMAFYNDPSMSFMTELFDRSLIKYISIPFEEEIYIRYLEAIVNCEVTLKGYSKTFMQILKELGNMIYPLVSNQGAYRPPSVDNGNSKFSPNMNNTLHEMKRRF